MSLSSVGGGVPELVPHFPAGMERDGLVVGLFDHHLDAVRVLHQREPSGFEPVPATAAAAL